MRVVTPPGERPGRADGHAAEGPGAAGGDTDGRVAARSAEQPTATGATATRATVPHSSGRHGCQRTPSIYATLAAVMERTGFWECCRR